MERPVIAGNTGGATSRNRLLVGPTELIEAGSADPVAVLFEERYVPLVRLAVLLGASREVAEEKVMDAFAGLASRIDTVVTPSAYLRTAVVNGVRSHHRRLHTLRRQPRPRQRSVVDPEVDELWERLALLKPTERACVVLRYYEDLPVVEIARVLDMPVGTVKSHLHRGVAALRGLLREEDK
jgi:RNA polymerase sigma factor (sigma-70 family)